MLNSLASALVALSVVVPLPQSYLSTSVSSANPLLKDVFQTKSLNQKLLNFIPYFEGFRAFPYGAMKGANHCMIGYGFAYINNIPVSCRYPQMSPHKAKEILINELIANYWRPMVAADPRLEELNANQKTALLSFVYNVGLNSWYYSRLRKQVVFNPNNKEAIASAWKNWTRDDKGMILPGLVSRRYTELELFLN